MIDISGKKSEKMSVVVTRNCNYFCPFCADRHTAELKDNISLGAFEAALGIAKGMGMKKIAVTGGEPTLHPQIMEIARMVKEAGFRLVMTTNYSKPETVKVLDRYADSFKISYYGQKDLPDRRDFSAKVILSTLMYKGHFDSKEAVDAHIDRYGDKFDMKFSTLLFRESEWEKEHADVPFLDSMEGERVVISHKWHGLVYRDAVFYLRYVPIELNADKSMKCMVDGTVTDTWGNPVSAYAYAKNAVKPGEGASGPAAGAFVRSAPFIVANKLYDRMR